MVGDYILLRVADSQQQLYARTVEAYQKSLQITQSQYRVGVATRADVELANTTLQSTQAQAIDIEIARRQAEHAIAVLLGRTPAGFSIAPESFALTLPQVPAVVPSKIVIDQARLPAIVRSSPPCTLAPVTAPNEYVPPDAMMAVGGAVQAGAATVCDGSTACSHDSVEGWSCPLAMSDCARKS